MDVGKVLQLEARRPLPPQPSPLMHVGSEVGGGCGVANGDHRESEGDSGEEDDNEVWGAQGTTREH